MSEQQTLLGFELPMKALSLWEPWATLIAVGVKTIETRSWAPPRKLLGERIAIHAAKHKPSKSDLALLNDLPNPPRGYHKAWSKYAYWEHIPNIYTLDTFDRPHLMPLGKVLATATLADVIHVRDRSIDNSVDSARGDVIAIGHSLKLDGIRGVPVDRYGDFSVGRYLWLLEDVRAVHPPVAAVGRQGLWTWRAEQ